MAQQLLLKSAEQPRGGPQTRQHHNGVCPEQSGYATVHKDHGLRRTSALKEGGVGVGGSLGLPCLLMVSVAFVPPPPPPPSGNSNKVYT